jgi:hypothetical protein
MSPSTQSTNTNSSTRALSERTFNYKFSKINVEQVDSDDYSSEDEYQIEKRLRESQIETSEQKKFDSRK